MHHLQNDERRAQEAANGPEARKRAKFDNTRNYANLDLRSEVCKVQRCRTPLDTEARAAKLCQTRAGSSLAAIWAIWRQACSQKYQKMARPEFSRIHEWCVTAAQGGP